MKTTIEFLDAVKAARGLTSDYQLAIDLDCSRQMVSRYRSGKDLLSEEMACKIASILQIESGFVLACVAAERSKMPEAKKAWEWFADHMGGIAAALALVAILPAINLSGDSFNMAFAGLAAESGGVGCILCKMMPGALSALWLLLLTLALLAFRHFPRHTPRPKNN